MRFATFLVNDYACAGIEHLGGFYTFPDLLGNNAPQTVLDFIRFYEYEELPNFANIIAMGSIEPVKREYVTLQAPIPCPFRNVFCLGKNYIDHAKEISDTIQATQNEDLIPQAPIFFTKAAYPAVGDGAKIPLHEHLTQKIDYEAELAVVIGKTVHKITPEEAGEAIFGYTILNDLSARDIQTKHAQWFFGKSLDGFCPIGPVIVSRDEIPFPPSLKIECRVNGEVRQLSDTSNLIFDIPFIISELSQGIMLFPGDIIATGTPAGVGHALDPPQYLKSGDKVECEIEKIGVLTNYF